MRRALAGTLALALMLGCSGGDDAAPPAASPAAEPSASGDPAPREPSLTLTDDDPLADLGIPPTDDEVAPAASSAEGPAPSALGCALSGEPTRLLPSGGPAALVWVGGAFVVGAYTAEHFVALRVRPGEAPAPIATVALRGGPPGRTAAPGIALRPDGRVALAFGDRYGKVFVLLLDASAPASRPTPIEVAAEGLDPRFAPVVLPLPDATAIAWTGGVAGALHVFLGVVALDGTLRARHDLTPEGGGSGAQTLVHGADDRELLFVDPRAGISLAYRTRIGDDGTPTPAEVVRPLGTPASPPALAAARVGDTTLIAYAATGSLATRAVGLVDAADQDAPRPLVAGLGYGSPLVIDALEGSRAALFAAEAPSAAAADAPHEVRVRAATSAEMGDALVLPGPATSPALGRGQGDAVALAFRAGDELRLALLRCSL